MEKPRHAPLVQFPILDDELVVGGLRLRELADRVGQTPFYAYDRSAIATRIALLRATLPAGTLSGAPKIRAMEIINELEPVRRNVYAGAVGYINWYDDTDLAIAIRTAVIKDGMLHVQAGAGIVADSDPQAEWDETLTKAAALIAGINAVND